MKSPEPGDTMTELGEQTGYTIDDLARVSGHSVPQILLLAQSRKLVVSVAHEACPGRGFLGAGWGVDAGGSRPLGATDPTTGKSWVPSKGALVSVDKWDKDLCAASSKGVAVTSLRARARWHPSLWGVKEAVEAINAEEDARRGVPHTPDPDEPSAWRAPDDKTARVDLDQLWVRHDDAVAAGLVASAVPGDYGVAELARLASVDVAHLLRLAQTDQLTLSVSADAFPVGHGLYDGWSIVCRSTTHIATRKWQPTTGSLVSLHKWEGDLLAAPSGGIRVCTLSARPGHHAGLDDLCQSLARAEPDECKPAECHALRVPPGPVAIAYTQLRVRQIDAIAAGLLSDARSDDADGIGEPIEVWPSPFNDKVRLRKLAGDALVANADCWKPNRLGPPVPHQANVAKHVAKLAGSRRGWRVSNITNAITDMVSKMPKDANGDPDWTLTARELRAREKLAGSLSMAPDRRS